MRPGALLVLLVGAVAPVARRCFVFTPSSLAVLTNTTEMAAIGESPSPTSVCTAVGGLLACAKLCRAISMDVCWDGLVDQLASRPNGTGTAATRVQAWMTLEVGRRACAASELSSPTSVAAPVPTPHPRPPTQHLGRGGDSKS